MDNQFNTYIEIDNVTLIRSTEKAGLFEFHDYEDETCWIPWSQIDAGSVDKDGETGTLVITEWIAGKLGFELES